MGDKPSRRRWPWAAVLIVAILAAYVGGYFALSEYSPPVLVFGAVPRYEYVERTPKYREVRYAWMVISYEPLRMVESAVRRTAVRLGTRPHVHGSPGSASRPSGGGPDSFSP